MRFYEKATERAPELLGHLKFNLLLCERRLNSSSETPTLYCQNVGKNPAQSKLVTQPDYYPKDHPAAPYLLSYQLYSVDIVIPVYNALEDVKQCLASVAKQRGWYRGKNYVVNDASNEETSAFLQEFCRTNADFVLIEHETNCGYTKTVNDGLRQSNADFVITLNSDTIVTQGWLQGLIRCSRSGGQIGIVGPLSNAASWQNVPSLLDEDNQFAVNELPKGWAPDDMAAAVRRASFRIYPRVPFVNGFCFMIAREVIEKIGYLDEETFPTGYGEENDYCLRAADAGFELAIADDTYVFHAKSKSFGHETRKIYSKNGSQSLKAKHGKEKVNTLATQIREMREFEEIRSRVQDNLAKAKAPCEDKDFLQKKIMFLLPVSGGGGGVHSIVQETMGMRRIGVTAKIAVPQKHLHKFIEKYSDIDCVKDLFVGYESSNLIPEANNFDVVVGTIYTSMKLVKEIVSVNPNIQPAYYIQDYEPLFSKPGTLEWKEARDSYTLVPGATLFAKTEWICEKVFDEHGIEVKKVSPSIDHDVYYPRFDVEDVERPIISAMIRPKTPRRGAERTMRVLKGLKETLGDSIQIEIFGCNDEDPLFAKLERNFSFVNHGELTRPGVAQVLRKSTCFIDLSDYQAFGRTGLESMASNCFCVTTKFGGVSEYAVAGVNAIIVDPFDESAVIESVTSVLRKARDIASLKMNSLLTGSCFSIHKAAISEVSIF